MKFAKCLFCCAVLTAAVGTVSYAEPRFARTEEEWAALEDDRLEYAEIPDLVHEYNIEVLKANKEYNDFIKKYGKTKSDVSEQYREMADELEDSMTGEDGMGIVTDYNLQLQADKLREQADDNLEDSYIYYQQNCKAEAEIVRQAQQNFLKYLIKQDELLIAEDECNSLSLTLGRRQDEFKYGLAVETDVLKAEEAYEKKRKEIKEIEQEIESLRQELIIACGWKATDNPVIGYDYPPTSSDYGWVTDINLEEATQDAWSSNYDLKINSRKLENAEDADNIELLTKTVEDNKNRIRANLEMSYRALQTAYRNYKQSVKDLSTAQRDNEDSVLKQRLGLVSVNDAEQSRIAVEKQQKVVEKNEFLLVSAIEDYNSQRDGLASIS